MTCKILITEKKFKDLNGSPKKLNWGANTVKLGGMY